MLRSTNGGHDKKGEEKEETAAMLNSTMSSQSPSTTPNIHALSQHLHHLQQHRVNSYNTNTVRNSNSHDANHMVSDNEGDEDEDEDGDDDDNNNQQQKQQKQKRKQHNHSSTRCKDDVVSVELEGKVVVMAQQPPPKEPITSSSQILSQIQRLGKCCTPHTQLQKETSKEDQSHFNLLASHLPCSDVACPVQMDHVSMNVEHRDTSSSNTTFSGKTKHSHEDDSIYPSKRAHQPKFIASVVEEDDGDAESTSSSTANHGSSNINNKSNEKEDDIIAHPVSVAYALKRTLAMCVVHTDVRVSASWFSETKTCAIALHGHRSQLKIALERIHRLIDGQGRMRLISTNALNRFHKSILSERALQQHQQQHVSTKE
eukprot:m.19474 g.19474  ORF g.19474 m.19474 type:complete len:372 (-) comp5123_c1_seq1:249-1364(-)